MMDKEIKTEEDLQDLAMDMVDTALTGLTNLEDKRGFQSRNSPEHELFTNTLISCMVYLKRCGIKPYSDEKSAE